MAKRLCDFFSCPFAATRRFDNIDNITLSNLDLACRQMLPKISASHIALLLGRPYWRSQAPFFRNQVVCRVTLGLSLVLPRRRCHLTNLTENSEMEEGRLEIFITLNMMNELSSFPIHDDANFKEGTKCWTNETEYRKNLSGVAPIFQPPPPASFNSPVAVMKCSACETSHLP